MAEEESRRQEFQERYTSGAIPWDDELPPPELMTFVQRTKPGRALDLGCGYGRSSTYLARYGWQVDGVDFVEQAVAEARRRAAAAAVADRANFYAADVSKLDFLPGPYDLALDIGCMHAMSAEALLSYRDGLLRLVAVGGTYLLFAHLRDEQNEQDEESPTWIAEQTLTMLFAGHFDLQHVEYGVTQVEDKPPWRSAWFTYRRTKQR